MGEEERNPLAVQIGSHIRVARERARPKMSQARAGLRLGLTESTYRSYELGDVLIAIDTLYSIARFFGRPITFFLGLPDTPPMSAEDRVLLTAFKNTSDVEYREVDLATVERNFRLDQKARRATSETASEGIGERHHA